MKELCPKCFEPMETLGTATHGYFNLCLKCRTVEEIDDLNPHRILCYTADLDGVTVVDSEIFISKTATKEETVEAIKHDLFDTFEINYYFKKYSNSIL